MAKPEIRLKGFEGEWMRASFSESFHFLKNNSLSRAELNYGKGIVKNIHYGDVLIKFGEILNVSDSILPFITNNDVASKQDRDTLLENGDIVFADAAEDNAVGKCTEIEGLNSSDKIVSGLHTIPSRPNYAFEKGYLGYYLNSNAFHDQLLPMIQGTKVSGISKANLNCTYISYPPNTFEQTALADYFKSLDSMIQGVTKKITSLKQMKQACLVSMFPQEGETTPRVRFKGFKGEWEKVKLGELCEKVTRKAPIDSKAPVMMISASSGFINQSEKYSTDNAGKSLAQYTLLYKGEMAYNHGASKLRKYGSCFTLFEEEARVPFVYHTFKLTKDNSDFYAYYLNSGIFDSELKKVVSSTARMDGLLNISYDTYMNIDVYRTVFEEQQKIASYFTSLDKQISLQEQRLEKLKQIKSACLDKMFV